MFCLFERRRQETLTDMTACLFLTLQHQQCLVYFLNPPTHTDTHTSRLSPNQPSLLPPSRTLKRNTTEPSALRTTSTVISLSPLLSVHMLGLLFQTHQCLAGPIVVMVTNHQVRNSCFKVIRTWSSVIDQLSPTMSQSALFRHILVHSQQLIKALYSKSSTYEFILQINTTQSA